MSVYRLVAMLLVCGLLQPLSVSAESPDHLRVLIVIGLENNIGLKVERINVPLGKENVAVEDAVFDPEIFASTSYLEVSTPTASSASPLSSSDSELLSGQIGIRKSFVSGMSTSLSLTSEQLSTNSASDILEPQYKAAVLLDLTQPLLRGFGSETNTTDLQLARNRQQQAALDYLLQAQVLALQIADISYQLSGQAEIVRLRDNAVALARELYTANQRRIDAGVIPISEVQEAETALADRELSRSINLQNSDQLTVELKRQLAQKLPVSFDPKLLYQQQANRLPQSIPAYDAMLAAALKKRLDLQIGQLNLQNSSLQRKYQKNQLQPRLDLKLQAGVSGLSGERRTSSVSNTYVGSFSDSFGSMSAADGFQWGAGLEFSLPFGNRAAKSRLRQAEYQEKQTTYRQRDLESDLATELQQQLANLTHSSEQLTIAERFERLAVTTLQQEQRRLEEGLSDTFRIISFQDKMIAARIGKVESQVRYLRTLAQLNYTRGIILDEQNIEVRIDTEEDRFDEI